MERRPTSILTTLTVSVLALTLIAPWALGQDPDRIAEIRSRAEQGDVDAQFTLGNIYSIGQIMFANGLRVGPESDAAEAVKWYRLAARAGPCHCAEQPRGYVRLWAGRSSRTMPKRCAGIAKLPSRVRPRHWYNLGLMYDNGSGVPENDAEAVKWYWLAADQGLPRPNPTSVSCMPTARACPKMMPKL